MPECTVPQLPWPRFDRRCYLLLLDEQQRLLLCGGCCGGWTVPQVRMTGSADFRAEGTRFLAEEFGVTAPRYGPVYGKRYSAHATDWEFDRVTALRVFFVHLSDEDSDRIERSSATHVRWDLERLHTRRREVFPEGVVTLTTGYVEGWIPDGPISLY
ncbi:hypothetical protein [Streptomyces tubercidicus]|uniref:hypothetical protein n=1 Tax=Streptomyces tubercidicus TaxID=47759 RepID=UPI00367A30EF